MGDFDAAYEALQQATKADPKLEPAAVSMGWLFARSGDVKNAGEWMEYAAKRAPESLSVQLGVAAWLLEQGRGDEAQSHVDMAAKLDPKSIEVKRVIGLTARERKDLARAERVFQSLADDAPADSWARNQLSLVLADQNDAAKQKKAMELAELSVRAGPQGRQLRSRRSAPSSFSSTGSTMPKKCCKPSSPAARETPTQPMSWHAVQADRGHADDAGPLLKMALSDWDCSFTEETPRNGSIA